MIRKLFILSLILGIIFAFSIQSATATDPKWREKQEDLFAKIGMKPGDIIDKADWEKVDGLIPFSMVNWLKKGYLTQVKIVELKYDISTDAEWSNASKKNAGKFKLDETKNLVDAATGKPPVWVYGVPFPNLDIRNDPDGTTKFMWNRMVALFRAGQLHAPFTLEWIGPGGFERIVHCVWTQYCFWARPDGQVLNPGRYRYIYLTGVTKPYDLTGICQLTYRKLNGTADDFYVYVPAIRRIKKMSGANRSDPYVGSDVTLDDGAGFAGLTNSMTWRFIEERVGLLCIEERDTINKNKMKRQPDGGWRYTPDEATMPLGWQIEGWKGAPWEPVNAVWVPRTFYVIEGRALDPYYNSGKAIYWIDKDTYHTAYKVIWDKAGEYWKTINFLPRCLEWGDKTGYHAGGTAGYQVVDEKMNHATGVRVGYIDVDSPRVTPKMFTIERLRTMGK